MSDGKSLAKAFEAQEAFKARVEGFEKRNEAAEYVRDHFEEVRPAYIEILEAKSGEQKSASVNYAKATIEEVLKAKGEQDDLKFERESRLQTIDRVERQVAIGETLNWHAALLDVFWHMDSTVMGVFSTAVK